MITIRNNETSTEVGIIFEDEKDSEPHYFSVLGKTSWTPYYKISPLYIETGLTERKSRKINDLVKQYNLEAVKSPTFQSKLKKIIEETI